MKSKEVDDWAMYNQMAMKYKSQRQRAWLLERHNAFIRGGLQHAESQVIKESLCVSFGIVLGLVVFMHNAFVYINDHTPYQAVSVRQPHILPPLEGGYFRGLDVQGQNNLARVTEIVNVSVIEAISKMRLARGDKRNQVPFVERS